jgi:methyl-accepting chemotaxis protein WspA
MKHRSPHGWLVNRFSYIKSYIIVCLLFCLALLPIAYSWLRNYSAHVKELNEQIQTVQQEIKLKKLFDLFQEHQLLAHHYLAGNKDIKQEIESLEPRINALVQQVSSGLINGNISQEKAGINPLNFPLLETKWDTLRKRLANLSPYQSNQLHTALLNDLQIQLDYLTATPILLNRQQILIEKKSDLLSEAWLILLVTLPLIALAFYIGLIATKNATDRLTQLTRATDSFTNGNLSIRVPIAYHDEIGRLSQAFNRMAQKLEEIVNHLYELIDATTALANGDLSTRIAVKGKQDDEFNQVAISFNKMAETFEAIIGRLHQLGIILTSTATEVAAASREQETIIVEQEATTREIAIAANEISSTAKQFANTMNEISQVADQTSNLAFTGKDSLTNMESIMRQMVEASTNIASKLAILNEKAGNITGVITTITKVADQTNLLSLNASIEAEKAGEYGRSFAVIAREIRRLADQTAIATLDIEKIVDEIMTAVSSSVMGVDDFTQEIRQGVDQVKHVSGQLATIIEQVQAFTARFELVNQGMQAQLSGAEQITSSINQLSQTAQQTSGSLHQFLNTIKELNKASNELRLLTPAIRPHIKRDKTSSSASDSIHALFSDVAAELTAADRQEMDKKHLDKK